MTIPALNKENALAELCKVQPDLYSKTRNHLNGAVSRLSPFVTHGWLELTDLYQWGCEYTQRPLHPMQDKWVMELGWREFFQQVLSHVGWDVCKPIKSVASGVSLGHEPMPNDVMHAQTGIPAIDMAVRELVQTGYLHNHARMWLASYLVHVRKVYWVDAANWMLGVLWDGDVASNHLSWQWVAGTFSIKPYLFNADNVAKYASRSWHSSNTDIDVSYEQMAKYAASPEPVRPVVTQSHRIDRELVRIAPCRTASALFSDRPADELLQRFGLRLIQEPSAVEQALSAHDVWIHPWCMGFEFHKDSDPAVGILSATYHHAFPWSHERWSFVLEGMSQRCNDLVWFDPDSADIQACHRLMNPASDIKAQPQTQSTWQPGYRDMLDTFQQTHALRVIDKPTLWQSPAGLCMSYSQWIRKARFLANDATTHSTKAASEAHAPFSKHHFRYHQNR